jgi:glycosyltransferase involved in cell wall biosynthesis
MLLDDRSDSFRKRILIISYIFPPHPGIGGRRWAKFAKYLSREGFEVHVICTQSRDKEQSVWIDDVISNENIHVHYVKSFFPKALTKTPVSIFQKIFYRFWRQLAFFLFKGYIYDRTLFSEKRFVKKANEIIQSFNIDKVIVTGAPFRLVHAIVKAAARWKKIHLTADFRDPWTWEQSGDYQKLDLKNLAFEEKMETYVMNHAHAVSVPTLAMKQYLDATYPQCASKVMVLPHAWDEDEITYSEKKITGDKKLIIYGTLYSGIENSVRSLAKALKVLKGKFTVDIYSDSQNYKKVFKDEGAAHLVSYYSMKPSRQLYRMVHHYCAAIIINNDSDKDHVSTKFVELAAAGTPVLYMAADGKASEFVKYFNTGWHVKNDEIEEMLIELGSRDCAMPVSKLNIDNLSFSNVTKQFLKTAYNCETGKDLVKELY